MCYVCRNHNPVLSSFMADHQLARFVTRVNMTGVTSAGGSIIASPAYGVYVSHLIRYSRAYTKYRDFLDRAAQMLTLIPFGIRSQSCFLILPASESLINHA